MKSGNSTEAFIRLLEKGDLRSTGNVDQVVRMVAEQEEFDKLFDALFRQDRSVVLRAADAIEKITIKRPEFLVKHKKQVLLLLAGAHHIELKWHLAQLVPRLPLDMHETGNVWNLLHAWAADKHESRITRVNSIQSLAQLTAAHHEFRKSFKKLVAGMEREEIPSITARLRKLKENYSW